MTQQRPLPGTTGDHPSPLADSAGRGFPFRIVAVSTGRASLVGVISGAVAGLIAGGIGSRLAMRLVAVAGGPDIEGLETENGAFVGDITTGGTVFLIIFGMIIGAIGGLIYVAARSWLPGQMRFHAPLYGVLIMFIAAVFLLDKDNSDFQKVGHPVLSVTLFAAIPFLYGIIQVPVAGWLERRLPIARPSGSLAVFYGLFSLIVLLPLLPVIGGSLSENDGPLLLLILVPLALVYAILFLRTNGSLLGRRYAGRFSVAVRFAGYALLAVAAGLGAYQFVDSVTSILVIGF